MRVPFRNRDDQSDYLEPPRSPLIPLTCLLAVVGAIAVVGTELGGRLAIISAMFAIVALATRIPRVLPVTAVLMLAIAGFAVLVGGEGLPTLVAHAHHALAAHK